MKNELAEILFQRYPLIFTDYLQPQRNKRIGGKSGARMAGSI